MYKEYTAKNSVFGDIVDRCVCYIDGSRKVSDIIKLVSLEFMKDMSEEVNAFLKLLEEMKMINE